VDDYAAAAALLAAAPPAVVAVEVNLSCPNLSGHGRAGMFAHDAGLAAEAIAATAVCARPRWAKLSPNTDRLVEVASAVVGAGAEALTLVNTVLGMAFDPDTLRPALGSGPNGGGLSGRAIHPVAVRAVHDVHRALPDVPIVGVGGVSSGWDAVELLLAGATAVQVGTATFAEPAACTRIAAEIERWAAARGIPALADIPGITGAHGVV
jgi:dihydroorotate dehydrogenase (NAD+) catalytic subunit